MPLRFSVDAPVAAVRQDFVPIVIAGGVKGKGEAKATYERLLASARSLYEGNVAHYRDLLARTVSVSTPDSRLDDAFALGQGRHRQGDGDEPAARHRARGRLPHLRGQRASRLRVVLRTRRAVDGPRHDFLRRRPRHTHGARVPGARTSAQDGKVPHEISQSASLVPWFDRVRVPLEQRRRHAALRHRPRRPVPRHRRPGVPREAPGRESSRPGASRPRPTPTATASSRTRSSATAGSRAARSTRPTRRSTSRASGSRPAAALAEMAEAMHDAGHGRRGAGLGGANTGRRWRRPIGSEARGFYAFATSKRREKPPEAEPGPNRERRQARMEALAGGGLDRRGHRAAGRARVLSALLDPRARPVRDRPSRRRRDRHRLGRAHPLRPQPALRSALLSLRLGLAAVHRLDVPRGLPLRATRGRLPGAHGQRAAHVPGGPRLRDRAALGRLRRSLRALVAPPDLVAGHGGHAPAARPVRHRGSGRGPHAGLLAPVAPGLARRRGTQRRGGRIALRPLSEARAGPAGPERVLPRGRAASGPGLVAGFPRRTRGSGR